MLNFQYARLYFIGLAIGIIVFLVTGCGQQVVMIPLPDASNPMAADMTESQDVAMADASYDLVTSDATQPDIPTTATDASRCIPKSDSVWGTPCGCPSLPCCIRCNDSCCGPTCTVACNRSGMCPSCDGDCDGEFSCLKRYSDSSDCAISQHWVRFTYCSIQERCGRHLQDCCPNHPFVPRCSGGLTCKDDPWGNKKCLF